MKTNNPMINQGRSRRYGAIAIALLLSGLYINTTSAQDNRRSGERNGSAGEGGGRQGTVREQPARIQRADNRRQDVVIDRNNSNRDFNRNQNLAGYETVVIGGETFYTADGAQCKPVVQENGEIWYELIKAN
jgi:hypothetical protein